VRSIRYGGICSDAGAIIAERDPNYI
jgi:hypothetical protein